MANTKLINCDQLQVSLTRVKTYVDGKFSLNNHNHHIDYYTKGEINSKIDIINAAINGKADSSHNHASNSINAMTGYAIATESSAIAASDTLNAAIGKLEFKVNSKQDGGSYAPSAHNHDDRYYIKAEIDTKVSTLETADANNLNAAKEYTDNKVAALVDAAPETLDTLNELAAALGDDPNFAATMATNLGNKADKNHGHADATTTAAGFMTADMVNKLNGIANNANNYVHPTTEGNIHIPSGGAPGQFLTYGGASGTAQWVANPNTDSRVDVIADTATSKLYLTGATGQGNTGLRFNSNVYIDASTSSVYATTFSGALNGNASTATTASNCSGNAASASKVNNKLTLQFNGTTSKTFNGSSDQTFNVTCAAIGAATVADAAKATDAEVTTMLDTLFGAAS